MIWNESDVLIRYADTDQMGVVHHGVYPLYCEIGRTALCEQLGMPYHHLEAEGIYLMVVEMTCRYRAPARYGERIYVRSAITRLKKRLIEFRYEVRRRPLGELLFSGTSKHLFSQRTEGTISLPAVHYEKLASAAPTAEAVPADVSGRDRI